MSDPTDTGLTAEQWRRFHYHAQTGAATTTDNPRLQTVRLLLCLAAEAILAELEAGEAPAPAPSLSPGEGCRGRSPRPRPPVPQAKQVANNGRNAPQGVRSIPTVADNG